MYLQGIIMQGILHMNLPMSYWDIYQDTTYEFTHVLLGHLTTREMKGFVMQKNQSWRG